MITISLRAYSSHIKSLLHFNYPYYAEPGDGLTDEIDSYLWTRSGNAKLVGSESPADAIISGTPKFGYRCLHTEGESDYITGTSGNSYNIAASTLTALEASMWLRPSSSYQGIIMQLKAGVSPVLTLSIGADLKLSASASSPNFSITAATPLTLNTWVYVRLQLFGTDCKIIVNNSVYASGNPDASLLPAFNSIRLGGFYGEIDEFTLRDTLTNSGTVPTEPEKASCSVYGLGGFGDSRTAGRVVVYSAEVIVNSCAKVTGTASSKNVTLSSIRNGKLGDFASGSEVMIINMESGAYCFRTIAGITGNSYTLDTAPDSACVGSASQIIQVPNVNTLIVNAGTSIVPYAWDGSSGGIVAIRVQGDCTINGSIIANGKGRPRTDKLQITHSKLIDNFITNTGGGIFITCGGVFTAGSSARLGATWSGDGKGGEPVSKNKGNSGGAGYGGAGGSDKDNAGVGGKGGVGGGGGGGNGAIGLNAGGGTSTGGNGSAKNQPSAPGGTQGVTAGGNSQDFNYVSGGGGAGGNSGHSLYNGTSNNHDKPYCKGVSSGTNIILIVNTLKVDSAAISTGGEGGNFNYEATGGGGTGFCYIACENMN